MRGLSGPMAKASQMFRAQQDAEGPPQIRPCPRSQWIPDVEAPTCDSCKQSFAFSTYTPSTLNHGFILGCYFFVHVFFYAPVLVWRRRHHCRACGKVFCGNCSTCRPRVMNNARCCQRCYTDHHDRLEAYLESTSAVHSPGDSRLPPPVGLLKEVTEEVAEAIRIRVPCDASAAALRRELVNQEWLRVGQCCPHKQQDASWNTIGWVSRLISIAVIGTAIMATDLRVAELLSHASVNLPSFKLYFELQVVKLWSGLLEPGARWWWAIGFDVSMYFGIGQFFVLPLYHLVWLMIAYAIIRYLDFS